MIRSDRNCYVAAHVTRRVKEALRYQAKASGVSQSEFIFAAVTEKLMTSGALPEPAPSTEADVPLPFTETNT